MNLREIDRLVAEKVLGCKVVGKQGCGCNDLRHSRDSFERFGYYSSNIADAWEVVEKWNKMSNKNWVTISSDFNNKTWDCFFEYTDHPPGLGSHSNEDTAPLAICKAALKAVEVEV